MRGERNQDKSIRKFITIRDMDLWDKIDRIMTLPEYRKSFNKVINDALFFGLEMLEKSLFDEVEESDENNQQRIKRIRKINGINEEYFERVINRLDEVLLGVTLNKSMLCSLYQAKNLDLNGKPTIGSLFDNGGYSDTPDYLGAYEARALRRIRG